MAGGPGLDPGLSATVRQLWEQARPGALARVDAIAAVMAGALPDDQRDHARREAHKLAGSLGTFGLRDATGHAAVLEMAFEGVPEIDRVPELAQHARDLRLLIESGEGGARPRSARGSTCRPSASRPSGPRRWWPPAPSAASPSAPRTSCRPNGRRSSCSTARFPACATASPR